MPKINIKFSFLLFNAMMFMFRESRLILGFYIACLIHEAGHIIAVRLTGGEVHRIDFSWTGIKMTASPPSSLKAGILVQLSGPAANLLTFLILILAGNTGYLALFSLAEGLFNLLPYSFLDGGAALDMLAEGAANEPLLRKIYTTLRITVTAAIATFLICGLLCSYNF